MKKIIAIICTVGLALSLTACGGSTTPSTSSSISSNSEEEHKLLYGDLLEWNEVDDGKVLVIKAKITPQLTNDMTVQQNYLNVSDVIKNQGGSSFDTIDYWAVADMNNGDENKVVSFTLDSDTIQRVADGSIIDINLGSHATDLFIHPSLRK